MGMENTQRHSSSGAEVYAKRNAESNSFRTFGDRKVQKTVRVVLALNEL